MTRSALLVLSTVLAFGVAGCAHTKVATLKPVGTGSTVEQYLAPPLTPENTWNSICPMAAGW